VRRAPAIVRRREGRATDFDLGFDATFAATFDATAPGRRGAVVFRAFAVFRTFPADLAALRRVACGVLRAFRFACAIRSSLRPISLHRDASKRRRAGKATLAGAEGARFD